MRKTKRGGQRGYEGLSIKRAPRRQPGFEFGGRQMLESIANFMRINPPPLPPIKVILFFFWHNTKYNYCLYNPRNAGVCAFTSRDIERGEVVVEYDGERVEMEEAARREERYTEEGRPCTLMVIKRARQQVV